MPSTTTAMAQSDQSAAGPAGSFLWFSSMSRERVVRLIGPQTCHKPSYEASPEVLEKCLEIAPEVRHSGG
jgi:hypothetical protein